jgi:hypothetical protein
MAKVFQKDPQMLSINNLSILMATRPKSYTDKPYPVRPQNNKGIRNRFKCAWMVFTGRADATTWPRDQ